MFDLFTGNVVIADNLTFSVHSDLNGECPRFTLTCTSIGGPATTVTWTRDSQTLTEGMVTVLDDPVTAQYTHNLTVAGRLGGQYQCTVANNKPSLSSKSFTVKGKKNLMLIILIILFIISLSLSLSSCLSSHWPHCSPGRSHWYPNLLDPTLSTGGYNWV